MTCHPGEEDEMLDSHITCRHPATYAPAAYEPAIANKLDFLPSAGDLDPGARNMHINKQFVARGDGTFDAERR